MFPEISIEQLVAWGLRDPQQAKQELQILSDSGLTPSLVTQILGRFSQLLPLTSDPDDVLRDYVNLIQKLSPNVSFSGESAANDVCLNLINLFSMSQPLRVSVLEDLDIVPLLEHVQNANCDLNDMSASISEAIQQFDKNDSDLVARLHRLKNQRITQIGFLELIFFPSLEIISEKLTTVCESIIRATVQFLLQRHEDRWGNPIRSDGQKCRFAVLALSQLGGRALSYSNDIELICIYDEEGKTDGVRSKSNQVFFESVAKDLEKMLGGLVDGQEIYRVHYPTPSSSPDKPLVMAADEAIRHYDLVGRPWERQSLVRAHPVAGDIALGKQFIDRLSTWIYRRYLSVAEITEIKALKRRLENLTQRSGDAAFDVIAGHGGIRDVEFVIQFLQLLNGADLPEVRSSNTLEAMESLTQAGFLNHQEQTILSKNYRFLKNIEHRLQLSYGTQTQCLPRSSIERGNFIAQHAPHFLTFDNQESSKEDSFEASYEKCTAENRGVLNHLLHDAFVDDRPPDSEVDLVFDPNPDQNRIEQILAPYGFKDTSLAYRNLMRLAREEVPFLSTPRCRYFLAAIVQDLLKELCRFPDPDTTLFNLCRTTASLGAKGVLWELFSFHRPTLSLYTSMCATSPYLSNILIRNPGMIDELMDGLMLEKIPEFHQQEAELTDLCKGAEDIDPIVHSFHHAQTLRVGVRDIVGREGIEATRGALSDIAETCLREWARFEYAELVKRLGEPVISVGPRAGHIAEFIIVALGSFAGRELSYNDNLDLLFLYEADGGTQHRRSERKKEQVTSNQHFFSELAQRILKRAAERGPLGRMYVIDTPVPRENQGGPLAKSLNWLESYFQGEGVLLETRLLLFRSRVVLGNELIGQKVMHLLHDLAFRSDRHSIKGEGDHLHAIRADEFSRVPADDFYLGSGGVRDIELIVKLLQIYHASKERSIRQPNIGAALLALQEANLLNDEEYRILISSYRLFSMLESRMHWTEQNSCNQLPGGDLLEKLAIQLSFSNGEELARAVAEARIQAAVVTDKIFISSLTEIGLPIRQ